MKKILIGLAVVVLLAVAGGYYVFSNLGGIIKAAVEDYGSEATQATVSLDSVDLDVTSGKAGLNGFVVGNPSGFETESAFKLGSIAVQVDPSSIYSSTILIKSVAITNPKVTYELVSGSSNIDAIQKNVDAYAKKLGAGGSSASSSSSDGEEKKIIIEKLTITGGEVAVAADFLGGKEMGSKLPTITLTNIGKDSGGATPAEVIQKVIDSMTQGVGSAIGSLDLDGLAKGATDQAKKALEGVTSGAGAAGDAASGAVDGATDKLKGLLGN